MNAPLLLTSVALLYGVAAMPVDRQPDDIANQDTASHSDNRQVFLHSPNTGARSQFGDGLGLDGIPLTPVDDNGDGDVSFPKLIPLDSTFSDPGLSSPYMGAQHRLTKVQALGLDLKDEQQNALSALSPMSSRLSSPTILPGMLDSTHEPQSSDSTPTASPSSSHPSHLHSNYSPMIAVMVVSSLCALILLGLAVCVAYVSQLLRLVVLQKPLWRMVASINSERDRSNLSTSDKPVFASEIGNKLVSGENLDEKHSVALTRQVPPTLLHPNSSFEKANITTGTEQILALREPPADNDLVFGRAILAWTYDNWITHFMFALFGWMGVFLRGFSSAQD